MKTLPGVSGFGGRGSCAAVQLSLHDPDLRGLRDDYFLREPAQHRVLAVEQLGLGHVDRALVMRNHHRGEVVVGIAVHRRATHAHLHDVHRVIHQGGEGLFARRTALLSPLSHVCREGRCREEQSRARQE
jgi:hypothetical protein